jgi:hypothetical protein
VHPPVFADEEVPTPFSEIMDEPAGDVIMPQAKAFAPESSRH